MTTSLRTPDQHKPTGTGFAIFSSHEEAAESLCMNGRLINATRFAMRWSRKNYFDFTSKTSFRASLKDKHARIVDLSKNGDVFGMRCMWSRA
ncbi:uncharacterized protein J4E87_003459 [Alternaria ethzedia]|uniref:uncharacterized protein n=1 Tax=Alternaria ethzedia TaxID=181014 RepID=UPI0020C37667|nr:uncharacterized protein J4E87_003459 [Alternaria ethzedia]KAI4629197.1 hypothetical protein J4E87_003459 [Alternaria ethzedia]